MNPEIIINYANSCHELALADIPSEWVEAFEARLITSAETERWAREDEIGKVWYILRDRNYQNALAEAGRMGFAEHPELKLLHDPCVLVAHAQGREDGIELAKKWGLYEQVTDTWGSYFEPGCMWHEAAHRRDGDAVVLFVGDDRGYAPNWEYFVIIKWEPQAVEDWMKSRGLCYHS